jgi:hypothetical protein
LQLQALILQQHQQQQQIALQAQLQQQQQQQQIIAQQTNNANGNLWGTRCNNSAAGPTTVLMRGLPVNCSTSDVLAFFHGFNEVR